MPFILFNCIFFKKKSNCTKIYGLFFLERNGHSNIEFIYSRFPNQWNKFVVRSIISHLKFSYWYIQWIFIFNTLSTKTLTFNCGDDSLVFCPFFIRLYKVIRQGVASFTWYKDATTRFPEMFWKEVVNSRHRHSDFSRPKIVRLWL